VVKIFHDLDLARMLQGPFARFFGESVLCQVHSRGWTLSSKRKVSGRGSSTSSPSSYSQMMLVYLRLRGTVTERQVRLLTAAWCRRFWRLLEDERPRAVARLTEKNC
jgi:hypothetical protein